MGYKGHEQRSNSFPHALRQTLFFQMAKLSYLQQYCSIRGLLLIVFYQIKVSCCVLQWEGLDVNGVQGVHMVGYTSFLHALFPTLFFQRTELSYL